MKVEVMSYRGYGWKGVKWCCYFWFTSWSHLSLGLHIDVRIGNIEIHVPFGFLRVGRNQTWKDFPKQRFGTGWRWGGDWRYLEREQQSLEEMLASLRAAKWRVAVHNDYRLHGKDMTFWLFTHPVGVFVKGEGVTDIEALKQIKVMVTRYQS